MYAHTITFIRELSHIQEFWCLCASEFGKQLIHIEGDERQTDRPTGKQTDRQMQSLSPWWVEGCLLSLIWVCTEILLDPEVFPSTLVMSAGGIRPAGSGMVSEGAGLLEEPLRAPETKEQLVRGGAACYVGRTVGSPVPG